MWVNDIFRVVCDWSAARGVALVALQGSAGANNKLAVNLH